MLGVATTGDPPRETERARVRLDRAVLVANLVSGALWLSLLAFISGFLLLIGAVYVVAGSVFLAAVYAREVLTKRQEALAWIAPWLVAVALWMVLVIGIESANAESTSGAANAVSRYLFGLYVGLITGTPCYLAWQIVALAVRQFMAWRSGRSSLPT